jgi:proline iminopeptidase
VGNPTVRQAARKVLHGGPGGGIDPVYRRYFDPKKWRIVLFDQRGCGKSTPHAGAPREYDVGSWPTSSVFGRTSASIAGSSSAAVGGRVVVRANASVAGEGLGVARHLHASSLGTLWFYQEGAHQLFPDAWEDYVAPIPKRERVDTMKAY